MFYSPLNATAQCTVLLQTPGDPGQARSCMDQQCLGAQTPTQPVTSVSAHATFPNLMYRGSGGRVPSLRPTKHKCPVVRMGWLRALTAFSSGTPAVCALPQHSVAHKRSFVDTASMRSSPSVATPWHGSPPPSVANTLSEAQTEQAVPKSSAAEHSNYSAAFLGAQLQPLNVNTASHEPSADQAASWREQVARWAAQAPVRQHSEPVPEAVHSHQHAGHHGAGRKKHKAEVPFVA